MLLPHPHRFRLPFPKTRTTASRSRRLSPFTGRCCISIPRLPRRTRTSSGRSDIKTWPRLGRQPPLGSCPPGQSPLPANTFSRGETHTCHFCLHLLTGSFISSGCPPAPPLELCGFHLFCGACCVSSVSFCPVLAWLPGCRAGDGRVAAGEPGCVWLGLHTLQPWMPFLDRHSLKQHSTFCTRFITTTQEAASSSVCLPASLLPAFATQAELPWTGSLPPLFLLRLPCSSTGFSGPPGHGQQTSPSSTSAFARNAAPPPPAHKAPSRRSAAPRLRAVVALTTTAHPVYFAWVPHKFPHGRNGQALRAVARYLLLNSLHHFL